MGGGGGGLLWDCCGAKRVGLGSMSDGCGVKDGRFWNVVAMDVAACKCASSSLCARAMSKGDVIVPNLVVGLDQGEVWPRAVQGPGNSQKSHSLNIVEMAADKVKK